MNPTTIPAFQITKATPATLLSKTSRDEKHGNDQVPAISLRWRFKVPNTWLDMLSPGLCAVFYEAGDDAQGNLPGTEVVPLTKLRTTAIGALEVHNAYKRCKLGVAIGADDKPIQFGDCKVDKFVVHAMHDGGSVELDVRIGTSDIDARTAGRLVMMTAGSTHELLIDVPAQDEDEAATKPTKAEADKQIKAEGPTPIEALAAAEKKASKLERKVAAHAAKAEKQKQRDDADQQFRIAQKIAAKEKADAAKPAPKHKPRTEEQKAARKLREANAKLKATHAASGTVQ